MKRKSLLILVATLMGFIGQSKIFAAATVQDITWSNYAKSVTEIVTTDTNSPTYVYLYNTTAKAFLTSGGEYGAYGIMADVGMRFYIVNSGRKGYYKIISRFENNAQGSAVAINNISSITLDRSETLTTSGNTQSLCYWQFTGDKAAYAIRNYSPIESGRTSYYNPYMYYNSTKNGGIVAYGQTSKSEWIIVTEADYRTEIDKLEATFINVSGLLYDSRFDRNNKDVTAWTLENASINNTWTTNGEGLYGAFNAATINGNGSLTQTVSNLKPGLYRVTCQAFLIGETNDCTYLTANNEKVLIKTCSQSDFNEKNKATEENEAVGAGYIFAGGNMYNTGESNSLYLNEVYVMVTADADSSTGSLTLGISNTCSSGVAYADNFQLYYCGTQEMYLDALNTSDEAFTVGENGTPSGLDKAAYEYPVRLNLRRAFTKNAWNAIVLPFDLSGDQVKAAFGTGDAKLSKLVGINPERSSQILFKSVDLDKEGLSKGECYVVWVTKDADVAVNTTYSYKRGNNTQVTVPGPIYHIEGVTQDAYEDATVTKTYETTSGTLNFTGYYTKPTSVAAQLYIVKNGKMYHLTSEYNKLYATYWTLADVENTEAKSLTFAIDGEDMGTVTAIEGITAGEGEPVSATEAVYNLNGQRVATAAQMEALPKGVYVIKGKKVLVK